MNALENYGFEVYALWNAIKLHFTSDSYDYFKYQGKTSVTKDSFMKNKQKYYFYRIARKYSMEEVKGLLLANGIENHLNYAGYLETPEAEENFKEWQKRINALTRNFENDIIHILKSKNVFEVRDGQYPKLLKMAMSKEIALETICIMDDLMNFIPLWRERISDDYVWPNYCRMIQKYKMFLDYDKTKFKKIIKEKLEEHAEA
jgi:hypothetical protein